MAEEPDLNFLVRRQDRILAEIRSLRDDMSVLTSIVLRQDGTLNALLQEVRATHTQILRINERVRKLESQSP